MKPLRMVRKSQRMWVVKGQAGWRLILERCRHVNHRLLPVNESPPPVTRCAHCPDVTES